MREPLLCVTVTGSTTEELRRARDAASATADMVEIRLDSLAQGVRPDVTGALDGRLRPVIVTCRPAWERGGFTGSEEERQRILVEASASGAEFVDVEAQAGFAADLIRGRRGRGIIVSSHLFGEPPADLAERALAMRSTGAEVVKIAIEAQTLSDVPRSVSRTRASGTC
jgi:3-dehydroquinate dehydratase type I